VSGPSEPAVPGEVPLLLPGVSAWEHQRRRNRYGWVGLVFVLCLLACAALAPDSWKGAGIFACVLAIWRVGWLQDKAGRAVYRRLREERAAGYQTLGAMMRPDIPLLDGRTGELIRPARGPRGG
jgi:hypothetical protein